MKRTLAAVYIVTTSNEYSFEVLAVFSTENKAKEFIKSKKKRDPAAHTYHLNRYWVDMLRQRSENLKK